MSTYYNALLREAVCWRALDVTSPCGASAFYDSKPSVNLCQVDNLHPSSHSPEPAVRVVLGRSHHYFAVYTYTRALRFRVHHGCGPCGEKPTPLAGGKTRVEIVIRKRRAVPP